MLEFFDCAICFTLPLFNGNPLPPPPSSFSSEPFLRLCGTCWPTPPAGGLHSPKTAPHIADHSHPRQENSHVDAPCSLARYVALAFLLPGNDCMGRGETEGGLGYSKPYIRQVATSRCVHSAFLVAWERLLGEPCSILSCPLFPLSPWQSFFPRQDKTTPRCVHLVFLADSQAGEKLNFSPVLGRKKVEQMHWTRAPLLFLLMWPLTFAHCLGTIMGVGRGMKDGLG